MGIPTAAPAAVLWFTFLGTLEICAMGVYVYVRGNNMLQSRLAPSLLLSLLFPTTTLAAASSQTVSLNFEECLARKEAVISQLGVNPKDIIPVVNTNIMTMTKLCTVDGSVIVTCSRPDKKMVITQSTNSCR